MKLPEYKILSQESVDKNHYLHVQLNLTTKLDYFDGHFEGMLILPAVAQLDMVKRIADNHWIINTGFSGLQLLKFKAPIWPEEPLELKMTYLDELCQLKFQYTVTEQIKSHGTFLFGAGGS